MSIGPLAVTQEPEPIHVPERETVNGVRSQGTASAYAVEGDGTHVRLLYVRWRNGEREVRCVETGG